MSKDDSNKPKNYSNKLKTPTKVIDIFPSGGGLIYKGKSKKFKILIPINPAGKKK